MNNQTWSLIGSEANVETLETGGTAELGFTLRRLNSGLGQGLELLEITCGELVYTILPRRGMGLWRAAYRGTPFGWQSPVPGPVHPRYVPVRDPSGFGFLDGFDELLTRCGLTSSGAPEFDDVGRLRYPLHGRIANLPPQSLEIALNQAAGTLDVRASIREARFHFGTLELYTVYRVQRGHATIHLQDTIVNCGDQKANCQLLYHINFGPPLLEEGARFLAPVHEIAPRDVHAANGVEQWSEFRGPTPGFAEECMFMDLYADKHHLTEALLCNAQQNLAAFVRYNVKQLPYFTLWKDTGGLQDGYVAGMEPGTNFPNIRSFEEKRGRVLELAPGEEYPIQLELGFCVDSASVAKRITEIERLQVEPAKVVHWMSEKYSPEGISDLS